MKERRTCENCKWLWVPKEENKPYACYKDGKWRKWLKKGIQDKPTACEGWTEL